MQNSIENNEAKNGYTPRAIISGFQRIDQALRDLAKSDFQPGNIHDIRFGIMDIYRHGIFQDEGLINPFENYNLRLNIDISQQLKHCIIDRTRPEMKAPGHTIQETLLTGLHFLEIYPDEISRQSYLIGDNEVKKFSPRQPSSEDMLPNEY